MNIFISWSGNRSHAVALLLKEWIQSVVQATKPWLSSSDIDAGTLWFNEINEQLSGTSVGIICLTQDNRERPWILFEAGALAKGLTTSRVCTFLVDLQPSDLTNPLAQFNHTLPDRAGVLKLVRTINRTLGDLALDDARLSRVFNTYWPQFERDFKAALKANPIGEVKPPRSESELLEEILSNTRSFKHRLSSVESRLDLIQEVETAPVKLRGHSRGLTGPRKHLKGKSLEDAIKFNDAVNAKRQHLAAELERLKSIDDESAEDG